MIQPSYFSVSPSKYRILFITAAVLCFLLPAGTSSIAATEITVESSIILVSSERERQAVHLTKFDDSFTGNGESGPTVTDSIPELIKKIKKVEQEYLDELMDYRSSYGIYALGEFNNDFENSESQYSAGLRWKIFNDGYFEAVREDAKKILQTQLEFYQLRRDMVDRNLENDLFTLFTFENRLNSTYFEEKNRALDTLLAKRIGQLKHGYTTEVDVLDIHQQLKKNKNNLAFYSSSEQAPIPADKLTLFNQVENIHLKPSTELLELTKTNSFDLKIQDNLTERAHFLPAWIDDVVVNIDAEYKREFYEKERSIIGFQIEVPLSTGSDRDSLIETQQRVYKYQKQAIYYRLEQKLNKLFSFYEFQQHRLLAQQDDIEILLFKTEKAVSKETNILQQFETDPARNLDLLAIELIDARYEALRIRLKMYEIILKLLALTQSPEITALFEFD